VTAADVIEAAIASGKTIATAESCTGGGVGKDLTSVSGASNVFNGGIIAYSNDAKIRLLDVSQPLLDKYGAVSERVAECMALGARNALGSDVAVSITGIAGPSGGSVEKPVGTVWIGVSSDVETKAYHNLFQGDREAVRSASVKAALGHLYRAVRI